MGEHRENRRLRSVRTRRIDWPKEVTAVIEGGGTSDNNTIDPPLEQEKSINRACPQKL
jgi:hypothetical protein